MSNLPASPAGALNPTAQAARPADPPRPVTRAVRRQTWAEARVRPWWLLGSVLLIIATYFVSTNMARSRRGRWLVQHGIKGQVRLDRINAETVKGKRFAADASLVIDMTITLPGRAPYTLLAQTLPDNRDSLECQQSIDIYVDPNDQNRFTTTATFPMENDLLVGGILLPFVLFLLAYAWFLRGRYLNLWKHGDAAVAVVIGCRQSPVAPFSRLVQCALRDHKSATIFSLLVPNRMGTLEPGDDLWIIVNLKRPSRAILAALYEQA